MNPLALPPVSGGAVNALYESNALHQVAPGNIDLTRRPRVPNPDGTISTVRSMSINVDGLEYLIPTVSEDGRIMNEDEAIDTFFKSRKHLGAFETPEEATAYAEWLHRQQEAMYR